MAQTMVNFRMDEDLKRSMERVCSDMGMSMTTAFTIFAKKVTRENRIPFEVSAYPSARQEEPNEETIAAIQEIQEIKKNPGNYKRYGAFSEILNEVKADV
ncbi:MAG: type II toxin-antitoxin system RelB/DinJ family antitoxin [Ruminiclostridium sp.]|nr:type II toxin-antitoxin system RelB/DinJ family antitoxin [Ruminiclostridium sp.]